MDTAKKYKWALGGLSIMILLNALIIITLWVNRPGDRDRRFQRGDEDRREAVHQYMTQELGLSDAQRESMRSMRMQHFAEARQLRRDLEASRRAYFDFVMEPDSGNMEKKDSLLTELNHNFMEVEESVYRHMSEMKAVLDSSQQRKFTSLMKEMLMRNQRLGRRMPSMQNH